MILFYNMLPNGEFDDFSLVRVNVVRGERMGRVIGESARWGAHE